MSVQYAVICPVCRGRGAYHENGDRRTTPTLCSSCGCTGCLILG